MMRPSSRAVALTACFTVAIACNPAPVPTAEAQVDDSAVRQELAQRMAAYRDALMQGDPAAVTSFWTTDSRILEQGMDVTGDGLQAFVQQFYSTGKVNALDIRPLDVFVHGNAAYELGQYDEVVQIGAQVDTIQNNYFLRWEKQADGSWKIDRFVAGPRNAPATQ
jgi:ketosteroid isomerase-like protein